MGALISLISAALSAIGAVFKWLSSQQLIELGADRSVLKGKEEEDREIADAKAERERVRDAPSSKLRDDDGFRRDD